jgi:DNA polymerase-3 subunit beta
MGMSIETDQDALVSRLGIVTRGVATKGPLQVLTGVNVIAGDEGVELQATDTQLSVRVRLPASVARPGSAVIPGRLMLDVVKSLPAGQVQITEEPGGNRLAIAGGSASFSLFGFAAADFPRMPSVESGEGRLIPKDLLVDMAIRVGRSASRDETRPILRGVLMSLVDETMTLVATDSYRLSVDEAGIPAGEDTDVIVPGRALGELVRIAPLVPGGMVEARILDTQILFRIGDRDPGPDDVWLMSRLIDGTFPSYRQLLPETYKHEVTVDRHELLDVIRRVSLLAVRNSAVRLSFASGQLTVRAATADVGDASDAMPVDFGGESFEIGFNPEFLRDGLEAMDDDQVVLRLISPLRPALITPTGAGSGMRYLIMPIRPSS